MFTLTNVVFDRVSHKNPRKRSQDNDDADDDDEDDEEEEEEGIGRFDAQAEMMRY